MARNGRRNGDPRNHTAIIGSPLTMWEKLAWDVDVFQDTQRRMPDEDQPLAYAAINVAIAASSLRDWTDRYWVSSERAKGRPSTSSHFRAMVYDRVRAQKMCDAIANTSKHSSFSEGSWLKGSVELTWKEGTADWPSGYELQFRSGSDVRSGYVLFDEVVKDWWHFLCELGLAFGDQPLPTWQQNKLSRIFGRLSKAIPLPS